MPSRQRSAATIPALLALVACGCSIQEPKVSMTGDARELSTLLSDWNDAYDTPKKAVQFFVEGKAPAAAQLKKYRDYSYSLTSVPAPSGDTATLPVSIRPERIEGETTSKDWAFKKVGGAWKIESAPLP